MNKTIKHGLMAATCLFTLPLFGPLCAQEIQTNITTGSASSSESTLSSLKKAASNFTFNYFVKYLGPSLSDEYQDGATYNRFNSGLKSDGSQLDATSSHQTYQSFRLGYKLPKDMILSYGVTYQDDIKKGIKYEFGERNYGRSFNNHRLALWMPNIYQNSLVYLGTSVYYEAPTSDGSQENDMQYGAGIQPSLGFYTGVVGLSAGVAASFERDVYPDNEFQEFPKPNAWCRANRDDCVLTPYTVKRQTGKVSFSPFVNYSLNDKWALRSTLTFDWQQTGDQAETLEFGNNMDDFYAFGANYQVMESVNVSAGIEGSITVLHIDRTAMFATMGISI